jgi:hypothetical protein
MGEGYGTAKTLAVAAKRRVIIWQVYIMEISCGFVREKQKRRQAYYRNMFERSEMGKTMSGGDHRSTRMTE